MFGLLILRQFKLFKKYTMSHAKLFDYSSSISQVEEESGDEDDFFSMFTEEQQLWEHQDLAKVKIRSLPAHTDSINSCQVFSEDSKILTASSDMTMKIFDFDTGKIVSEFEGIHSDKINQARVSKDGNCIASVGWDRKVVVTDTLTGDSLMKGEHDGVVLACDISHDGRQLISGSDLDNRVKLWDLRRHEEVCQISGIHKSTITCCIFQMDDKRIVTTSMDWTAKVYDLRSMKITLTLKDHNNIVSSATVSPDGQAIATSAWDKATKIWDIRTGSYRSHGPVTLKGHDGCISSCKFSSDSQDLVTGGYDKCVIVWDAMNSVQKVKLHGHTDWVEDVDFTSDGKWILSASKDCTVRLWNMENCEGIPVVLANKRAIGVNVIWCSKCGKAFPLGQLDSAPDATVCVFCRLHQSQSQDPHLTTRLPRINVPGPSSAGVIKDT